MSARLRLAGLVLAAAACARSAQPPAPSPETAAADSIRAAHPPSIDSARMRPPVSLPHPDSVPTPSIDSARLAQPPAILAPDAPPPPSIDSARIERPPIAVVADSAPPRPPKATAPVRLAFVGDINLGTTTLPGGIPPDGGRGLFAEVDSLLRGDLVVGNFEGTLADSGTPAKCLGPGGRPRANCYAFVTPTRLAPRLAEAGFTHMNLANNHANDMGEAGRLRTERVLRETGLRTYGPLDRIAIDTLLRHDSVTVVGLVGFATYPHAYNLLDLARSRAVVDSVRPLVDVLVVTFHGGTEGSAAVNTGRGPEYLGGEPRGDLRRWARAVIDAGADAVVGHGPHVLRGIEFYRGKPIAYSLGNFATYRGFNLSGPLGVTAVLQLELGPDGAFRGGRLVPLVQPPREGPKPDPRAAAVRLVRRVSGEDFGEGAAVVEDDGTVRAPAP